jgi:hypothetical protein
MLQGRNIPMPVYANRLCSRDAGWIYAVQEVGTPLVKIGFTRAHNPAKRLRELWHQFGVPLAYIGLVHIPQYAHAMEQLAHGALASSRIAGEWFYLYMNQARLEALVATLAPVLSLRLARQEAQDQAAMRRDMRRRKRVACRHNTP